MKYHLPLFLGLLAFSQSTRSDLRVVETSEDIPERGLVTRLQINSRAGDFSLHPPTRWTLTVLKSDETLLFERAKENAVLIIRFQTNAAPNALQLAGMVRAQWPEARILEEARAVSRELQGQSIEFGYPSAAGTPYRTRLAALQCAGGHITFQLTGPDDWPAQLHNSWTQILNSLASDKAARRHVAPAS